MTEKANKELINFMEMWNKNLDQLGGTFKVIDKQMTELKEAHYGNV